MRKLKNLCCFLCCVMMLLCGSLAPVHAESDAITVEAGQSFVLPIILREKTRLAGTSLNVELSFLRSNKGQVPSIELVSAKSTKGYRTTVYDSFVQIEAINGAFAPGLLTEVEIKVIDCGDASGALLFTSKFLQNGKVVQSSASTVSVSGGKSTTQKATAAPTAKPTVKPAVKPTATPTKAPRLYVGDRIEFGAYEQDNNRSNGKEEIVWLVLKVDGNRALLISEKILDRQTYHFKQTKVTWETCEIREWLNNDFYNAAFTYSEKQRIKSVTVPAQYHPNGNIPRRDDLLGNDTWDKIFLLNAQEAEDLFDNNRARIAYPTKYAVSRGIDSKSSVKAASWFLRQPYKNGTSTPCINVNGGLDCANVSYDRIGIRPAMWIQFR